MIVIIESSQWTTWDISNLLHSPHWPLAVADKQSLNKLPQPRKSYLTEQPPTSILSPEMAFPPARSCPQFFHFAPTCHSHLQGLRTCYSLYLKCSVLLPFPSLLYIIAKTPIHQGSFFCVVHRWDLSSDPQWRALSMTLGTIHCLCNCLFRIHHATLLLALETKD